MVTLLLKKKKNKSSSVYSRESPGLQISGSLSISVGIKSVNFNLKLFVKIIKFN